MSSRQGRSAPCTICICGLPLFELLQQRRIVPWHGAANQWTILRLIRVNCLECAEVSMEVQAVNAPLPHLDT